MKVITPKKNLHLFNWLPKMFKITENGENLEILCPIAFELKSDQFELKPLAFAQVYRETTVTDGKKLWKRRKIVFEPKKRKIRPIRMAPSEDELVKQMAKKAGETPSEYYRNAVLKRVLEDLNQE